MPAHDRRPALRLPRRTFLRLAAGAAALPALSRAAWAQAYPSRPVRIVVGVPAGGAPDINARYFGQRLSERFGQPFVIENRSGAGGMIGAEAVMRAPPDGYTLLYLITPMVINALFNEKLNIDFTRDVAPIGTINSNTPFVVVVTPSLPVRTIPEFIAYAKANPGKINMASSGTGNLSHMAGELFKMMTGVDMVHVPFRGEAPAQAELMTGRVHVMFDVQSLAIEHIRAGRLRALAVTTKARSEALPDTPTVGEFVPGYDVGANTGLAAPRLTPAAIIETLNRERSTRSCWSRRRKRGFCRSGCLDASRNLRRLRDVDRR